MKHVLAIAALVFAFSANAIAQPHIAQSPAVNQGNGSTQTATLGSAVTAGDIVIVGCWGDSGATTTCAPPTTNTSSETWVSGAVIPPDGHGSHGGFVQSAYYTLSANGGWTIATCNYAGGGNFNNGCWAIEIAGCTGCTKVLSNTVVNNSSSTTLPGATITPANTGGFSVSGVVAESLLGSIASGLGGGGYTVTSTSDGAIMYLMSPSVTLLSPSATTTVANVSSSWTLAISPPAPVGAGFIGTGFFPQQ